MGHGFHTAQESSYTREQGPRPGPGPLASPLQSLGGLGVSYLPGQERSQGGHDRRSRATLGDAEQRRRGRRMDAGKRRGGGQLPKPRREEAGAGPGVQADGSGVHVVCSLFTRSNSANPDDAMEETRTCRKRPRPYPRTRSGPSSATFQDRTLFQGPRFHVVSGDGGGRELTGLRRIVAPWDTFPWDSPQATCSISWGRRSCGAHPTKQPGIEAPRYPSPSAGRSYPKPQLRRQSCHAPLGP